MTEAEFDAIDREPPAWLAQSRAYRTGRKPVWVALECVVCGAAEAARPKKWWPAFTWVSCAEHSPDELPPIGPGLVRGEYDGIGTHFVGIVDQRPNE